MMRSFAGIGASLALLLTAIPGPGRGAEVIRPAVERFAGDEVTEVPDFQRHVLPLMGRLGCNGRACHGSFQGQGGFRLSLFGYDFKMDHDALMKDGSHRVDRETPEGSKIIQKPTVAIPHKGGKRLEEDSWQYRLLVRWIEGGAKNVEKPVAFDRLEVTPREIVFERAGQQVQLKVVAYWADGAAEDVTCITRYRTNDESIAEIDLDGVVTSKGKGDTHVVAFYDNGVAVTQALLPVSDKVGPEYPEVPAPTRVDELVVAKLRKLGIVPSEVCSDAEFLRRLSLDMTGTLPAPREVEAFLADPSPSKREQKIDELLKRPTYAAWWATKFCDMTGANTFALQNKGPVQQMARHWYEWLYSRVKENVPYDKLVEGIVLATSRKEGQNFEEFCKEQSAYYRDKAPEDFTKRDSMPYYWLKRTTQKPEEKALNFSYTFLGVRLECAQCHKHPFDQWTQNDFQQFTAFFNGIQYGYNPRDGQARAREMIKELGVDAKGGGQVQQQLARMVQTGKTIPWQEVYIARRGEGFRRRNQQTNAGSAGRVLTPKVLGGEAVAIESLEDPREPLMEWMRSKTNPYFARAFVNRAWANYFGKGIINPPDDMNLANPPSNGALLEYLTDGFIEHNFDMKWLHREIVASETYQRSWKANATNELDERNFSRAVVRRLPAEVMVDAVAQATCGTTAATAAGTDIETRAIGPKAGQGLGRNGRGGNDYAARIFGASARDSNCDCNRSNEPNLLQSIYLQNDQEMLSAIERKGSWAAEVAGTPGRDKGLSAVEELENRIATYERNLARAESEKKEGAITVLEDELKDARRQLRLLRKRDSEGEQASVAAAAAPEPAQVVREAYLRTLSRLPSEREAAIAANYFTTAGDTGKGVRDLLWALLNTKEFITNH
jgi:hypothetical protein